MSSATEILIKEQDAMFRAAARRDAAIVQAMSEGVTAYALARALREALGEDRALTAEGIRGINARMAKKKAKPRKGKADAG